MQKKAGVEEDKGFGLRVQTHLMWFELEEKVQGVQRRVFQASSTTPTVGEEMLKGRCPADLRRQRSTRRDGSATATSS